MNFHVRVILLFGFCFIVCVRIILSWYSIKTNINGTETVSKQCEILTKQKSDIINSLLLNSSFIVSQKERSTLGLKDLAIATTTSLDHISEAIRSCDTFQQHPQLKNVPFLMYFIGEIPKDIQILYSQLCPVAQIIILNKKNYSYFLDDLSQFKFKALYQALTLQKYKILLAVDSSVRFSKRLDFNELISTAVKQNLLDVTLLSSSKHSAYPVIHPQMYKCFPNIKPINMQKMQQFQGGLILWIGSKNGKRILKRLLECTLKSNCLAPPGAKLYCDSAKIYSDNTTFSGCHRFDQSAINLILYEESNFMPKLFQWNHPDFIVERSAKIF